mmetsp:Transcript_10715/g.33797  ORF Transcript_10715/g.33797 Transcript_10715/m.33797 type:complete len:243 (-) Transcript_10715:254-982(-)
MSSMFRPMGRSDFVVLWGGISGSGAPCSLSDFAPLLPPRRRILREGSHVAECPKRGEGVVPLVCTSLHSIVSQSREYWSLSATCSSSHPPKTNMRTLPLRSGMGVAECLYRGLGTAPFAPVCCTHSKVSRSRVYSSSSHSACLSASPRWLLAKGSGIAGLGVPGWKLNVEWPDAMPPKTISCDVPCATDVCPKRGAGRSPVGLACIHALIFMSSTCTSPSGPCGPLPPYTISRSATVFAVCR